MASSNKNRQPSPAEQDEHRPLLRSGSHTVGSTSDASSSPQPIATATPASSRRRRNLIISAVLILLSSNLVTVLVDTAGNQLVEGAACKQLHPEVQDWYKDPICKSLDVQDRLALITGYEFTWALIPGLILAIPYGVFTDHYGPRAMMVLIALGGFITQATYLTVSTYSAILLRCFKAGASITDTNIWRQLSPISGFFRLALDLGLRGHRLRSWWRIRRLASYVVHGRGHDCYKGTQVLFLLSKSFQRRFLAHNTRLGRNSSSICNQPLYSSWCLVGRLCTGP